MEQIPIADLILDMSISPRFKVDEKLVEEYAETPAQEFPPIRVYRLDDGRLTVSDGLHRTAAARRRRETTISADVRDGKLEEAVDHAFVANVKHGKQLTREEKTAAVLRLRELHPDWSHTQVGSALELRIDRVREIYQAQDVREETGVDSLSQRRARAVAHLPPVVAGNADARRVFALTIETQQWSKDESEAALRTLKDPEVEDEYKLALLAGERPPLARNDEGDPVLLPETVARQAREDERHDATGALYEFLAAASALDHRLGEAKFEHMTAEDVRRSLDRLEGLSEVIERATRELASRLRVEKIS